MSAGKLLLLHFIAGMVILFSCSGPKSIRHVVTKEPVPRQQDKTEMNNPDLFLEILLKKYPQYFAEILKNRQEWNVQIIYTRIDRDERGIPHLQHHYFNLDSTRYFYPASTVKLPIVLLALQRLNELKEKGIDKNSTMITEMTDRSQTAVYNDPSSVDGRPSIAHYIKKILMVSDNDAFNRLYEFLGQEYINTELLKKGFSTAEIRHRLSISMTEEENRQTNPVKFLDSSNKVIYEQKAQQTNMRFSARKELLGKGYFKGSQLINEPMDFSKKNRIGLADLNNILVGLIFPGVVPASHRFNLTPEDNRFLYKYMSQLPSESSFPPYSADSVSYWPAYCKFLLAGAGKGRFPENIRIFNKVGDAYGQMTDIAYITDFKNKVEFFLSATIYCNSDGILNDDQYDYATVGLPFLKHLGEVVYADELKRQRKNDPDLSSFIFKYDK